MTAVTPPADLGSVTGPLSADRRGAGVACPTPCGLGIVGDEREVLEHEIAGGRVTGIWATRLVEAFEIHAASAERHRDPRTGACEAEQFHLRSGNGRRLADVETDRPIKGGQPRGISGNEPKTDDRPENHVR